MTKGNLLKLIRDNLSTAATELMKIEKSKGYDASKEIKTSSNPHVELVRFAKWRDNEQANRYTGNTTEIEENSAVPFPDSDVDGSPVWGVVSDSGRARAPMRGKASSMPPRTNKRGSSWNNDGEMDTELDPNTLAEIHALEAKLAALKDERPARASHDRAAPEAGK